MAMTDHEVCKHYFHMLAELNTVNMAFCAAPHLCQGRAEAYHHRQGHQLVTAKAGGTHACQRTAL